MSESGLNPAPMDESIGPDFGDDSIGPDDVDYGDDFDDFGGSQE